MPAAKFIIPTYDGTGANKKFTGHVVVDAEGCAGLYVHRTYLDVYSYVSPWRVSTVTGFRVYVDRLNTRAEARATARRCAAALPPQVLSGEWTGADWVAHDRESAERYKREFYGKCYSV